jgi:F-type H+-transporting ATPase subunit b
MNSGLKKVFFLLALLTLGEQETLQAAANLAPEGAEHVESVFSFSWSVLISQTINFFVLLYILNRFLFVPIGKILEKRREEIGRTRLISEKEHQAAMELKAVYEKHLANIEQEAYEIKQQVIHEANLKTAEILLEAKGKAERIVEEGEMELFSERQAAWIQLREEVVHLTLTAAERVVEESLDDNVHRKLINRTIERLETDLPYHLTDD